MKLFGLNLTLTRDLSAAPVDPALELINTLSQQILSGTTSTTGAAVNDDSVKSLSTAFACMKVLAEDIAATPAILYGRSKGGVRYRAVSDPRYALLHDQPNPEMTAFTFKELLAYQQLLPSGGAAYAEIERNANGDVVALWPLLSKDVEIRRDDARQIFYRVHLQTSGDTVDLPSHNVLFIPGMTTNGYTAQSPATAAANVIGLALALEKTASLHFANGGFIKDYLKTQQKLNDASRKNLRETWTQGHGNLNLAQRTAILEEGLEYVAVITELAKVMPPEVRAQQIQEVCRIYRMPPHKIGDYGRATWSNVEQMGIDYYSGTLLPWFTRWEQALNWKLRLSSETYLFFEFLADAYLRGDYKTRMEGYGVGIQNGIMTRNEVRGKENLPPIEGGDEIFVPMNMAPLSKVISGEISPTGDSAGSVKK